MESVTTGLATAVGGALVTVPNVVGMDLDTAKTTIEAAGLTVGTVTFQSHSTVPSGNGLSQNPPGGTQSGEEVGDGHKTPFRESQIAVVSSRVYGAVSRLLPQWFFDTFDESLIDDQFNIAKEEGGKIWWLKLGIVASQFVVKFAWRRFGQRKAAENAGSLHKGQGDES